MIEIKSADTDLGDGESSSNIEGHIMRGLLRGKSTKHGDNEILHDEETVVMRILRPISPHHEQESGGELCAHHDGV